MSEPVTVDAPADAAPAAPKPAQQAKKQGKSEGKEKAAAEKGKAKADDAPKKVKEEKVPKKEDGGKAEGKGAAKKGEKSKKPDSAKDKKEKEGKPEKVLKEKKRDAPDSGKKQSRIILGSNNRCASMLVAIRKEFQGFLPATDKRSDEYISRINKCVAVALQHRKMSIGVGNSIAFIKNKAKILGVDSSVSDEQLNQELLKSIDMFLYDRLYVADSSIVHHALALIQEDDAILTFGHSTAVELLLLEEKRSRPRSRLQVYIVDSKPLFEGRALANKLASLGVNTTYCLLNSVAAIMPKINKVIIGAAAVCTNGSVLSRSGTAMVSAIAAAMHKPVLCLVESYKFTEKAWANSLAFNERLGDWADTAEEDADYLLYDLTKMDHVSALITEVGVIPPSSVPVVIREYSLSVLQM